MTGRERETFHERLQHLARRVQGTVASAEEQARTSTGGDGAGDLSNTPLHLGDLGSEVYAQELGATLLENEQYLRGEILDALGRIDDGTFGKCENCGREIPVERLDAVPYTRYCVGCASKLQAGRNTNLNEGRPTSWDEGFGPRTDRAPPPAPGVPPVRRDNHAVGTAGGGTAVGGIAGTNIGAGEPTDSVLERAMGSGNFDVAIESEPVGPERQAEEVKGGFAGHSGGAVGGTPANKRARGGKKRPGDKR
jgi:RNA polymerase-binding transcription factor DksA